MEKDDLLKNLYKIYYHLGEAQAGLHTIWHTNMYDPRIKPIDDIRMELLDQLEELNPDFYYPD